MKNIINLANNFQVLAIEMGNAAEAVRKFRAVWTKRKWAKRKWAKVVRRKK